MKGLAQLRSNSNDFITQMPDEILVIILSFLPTKRVVVTSMIFKRWRFLSRDLNNWTLILMSGAILEEFLKNSSHLEMTSIHEPRDLTHIRVGERALNLKHLEIVNCWFGRSNFLSDFDLVSLTYKGREMQLHISQRWKLKQLDLVSFIAQHINRRIYKPLRTSPMEHQISLLHCTSSKNLL